MKSLTYLPGMLVMLLTSVQAIALELPAVIADNMVIKRETTAPLWGWSAPGNTVSITTSWGARAEAVADDSGKWMAKIKTPKASGKPLTITFKDINEEVTVRNVLAGDVWLASGQSNMQMILSLCREIETEDLDYPAVRRLRIPHNAARQPLEKFAEPLPWTPVCREIIDFTSATSYFFARHLYQKTGVPQGIIDSAWNGMNLEPFYAAKELQELFPEEYEAMKAHPKFGWEKSGLKRKVPGSDEIMPTPSHFGWIFNAKVAPAIPYAITGAVWYQGESNAGNKLLYEEKLKYLIGSWRKAFGQGDFPFYYVQLNSNVPTDGTPVDGKGFAGINEGMLRALVNGEIPNIGMAVTWDTGNPDNETPKTKEEKGRMLHCDNKRDVGIRLALWALRDVYGKADTVVSGPIYTSHKIEGDKIILSFDHVGTGLMVAEKHGFNDPVPTPGRPLNNFAIAGSDQKFVWAEAQIVGDTVVVRSPQVKEPKAVRFCFNSAPFSYFNFYNKEGLPASPFITDDWYQ